MTLQDIANARLHGQKISKPRFKKAADAVRYMGAVQAQDFAMSKWAVGLRMAKGTDADVQAALDKGEILRTHVMRPTWHLVHASDIKWLLQLTAPQVLQLSKSYDKQLGVTEADMKKTNKLIVKALEKESCLRREDIKPVLEQAKVPLHENSLSHYLVRAELDMLVCSGPMQGNKQTYMLLDERVPDTKPLTKEEAMAAVAMRYFTAHSPATVADFSWWSGLNLTLSRQAVQLLDTELKIIKVEEVDYYVPKNWRMPKVADAVHLLPAFDEYLISYKDRSAAIDPKHYKRTMSSNGIFWPTVVVNGRIEGLWKRTVKGSKVVIATELFGKLPKPVLELVDAEKERLAKFLQLALALK